MNDQKQISTIEDILNEENDLVRRAENKYGEYFGNAFAANFLLNNFLKESKSDSWIFIAFLAQIKKHYLLTLFSIARLHHVQAMLNLRQVLEAGVNAAYGLMNPVETDFAIKDERGILITPKSLDNKHRLWLENNYKYHSDFIKRMKELINNSCSHSNIVYATKNFALESDKFKTEFFDKEDEYHIQSGFWMAANVILGVLNLFLEVNKKAQRLSFKDDFVKNANEIYKENETIKEKSMGNPRFKSFVKMVRENSVMNILNTDAVIAAPNSHKVLLENDELRVVEVVILPGQKEPMHTHQWTSVMIVDSSTKIRYYNESGQGTEYPERQTSKEKPFVEWLGPEGLHAVENLDPAKIYHAIRIELKSGI